MGDFWVSEKHTDALVVDCGHQNRQPCLRNYTSITFLICVLKAHRSRWQLWRTICWHEWVKTIRIQQPPQNQKPCELYRSYPHVIPGVHPHINCCMNGIVYSYVKDRSHFALQVTSAVTQSRWWFCRAQHLSQMFRFQAVPNHCTAWNANALQQLVGNRRMLIHVCVLLYVTLLTTITRHKKYNTSNKSKNKHRTRLQWEMTCKSVELENNYLLPENTHIYNSLFRVEVLLVSPVR